ncbi:MAG: putative tfp pilus assembly protein FimV [Herbaspirillum sp.]|jgi:hypothetical protein|nr:putative tfp pilus assembly protein FimV [Herbaspirillum sp.]
MRNPNQFPGTGSIADSVEFVKKLWGIPNSGGLPGMLVPTLSLEDIGKKITDLKAVESWLMVNMNMLHATIQALEVQSATIANLQSMGAMLGATAGKQGDEKAESGSGAPSLFPFSFPGWPTAADTAREPDTQKSASAATAPEPGAKGAPEEIETVAAAGEHLSSAWWDLLQSQFKQAVSSALVPDMLKAAPEENKPAKSAPKSAPKSTAKSTTRSAAKPAGAKRPSRSAAKTSSAMAKKA